MEKNTANLLHGEVDMTWYRQGRYVKKFVQYFGNCLRYNKVKCRPKFGPSNAGPACHHVLHNSGSVLMESMSGLEARDVFLDILRVQYRYNIRITQIFSEKNIYVWH